MPTPSNENVAVGEALEAWVASLRDETEGKGYGMLGDWIAVVAMVSVGEDGAPRVRYYVSMRDGNMLPHVANGLLARGIDEVAEREEDDE